VRAKRPYVSEGFTNMIAPSTAATPTRPHICMLPLICSHTYQLKTALLAQLGSRAFNSIDICGTQPSWYLFPLRSAQPARREVTPQTTDS
jgi:hypothetical protein